MVTLISKDKLRDLEERISQLERERDALTWDSFPMDAGSVFGITPCFRLNKLTGSEILTRLNELYDYLGVERKTSPELTKLRKKNAS